jgi:DNA repair exonuclease SbcCD nuclease subunit
MTTILAIGDPHFKVDNIEESEHFLLQVQQWLVNNRVDSVVILGDVLHSHEKIFTFALNMALKFIKMCASFCTTYCMVGNHDATSNTIYCTSNHWMSVLNHIDNVVVVEKPLWMNDQVLLCPYVSDGLFKKMLDEFAPEYKKAKLIFAHQLFDGAQMGSMVATGVEVWDAGLPQIISGHLHDRQQPQPNLYYVGSSQQLAFNERSDKSLAKVTVNLDGGVKWEETFLSLRLRKVVTTNVAGVPAEMVKIKAKPLVTFKVIVKDTDAALKTFKKTVKLKELSELANVVSVQYKVLVEQDEEMKEADAELDFMSLLKERVDKEGDPYLTSYMMSCLTNSEDKSDKDVEL